MLASKVNGIARFRTMQPCDALLSLAGLSLSAQTAKNDDLEWSKHVRGPSIRLIQTPLTTCEDPNSIFCLSHRRDIVAGRRAVGSSIRPVRCASAGMYTHGKHMQSLPADSSCTAASDEGTYADAPSSLAGPSLRARSGPLLTFFIRLDPSLLCSEQSFRSYIFPYHSA